MRLLSPCEPVNLERKMPKSHSIPFKPWKSRAIRGSKTGVLIAALLAMTGCGDDNAVSYKFRLTMEASCDGETHVGSGVFETVSGTKWDFETGHQKAYNFVHGDAVPVDMGPCGTIFVLLRGPQPGNQGLYTNTPGTLPLAAFADRIGTVKGVDFLLTEQRLAEMTGVGALKPQYLPMIVTFSDLSDPRTVKLVDPFHMDASLEHDAKFVRATVEITRDTVTGGIENSIAWLKPGNRFSMWLELGGKTPIGLETHPERLITDYDLRGEQ
jgi:hypothetical protein